MWQMSATTSNEKVNIKKCLDKYHCKYTTLAPLLHSESKILLLITVKAHLYILDETLRRD